MRSFRHLAPPLRLFCGNDSLSQLGPELDRIGAHRAMIVCGHSLAHHPIALALVRDALGARYAGVFDGAQAHSPVPVVQDAARALMQANADAVIAVGGGSAIVTARAASILAAEGMDPRSLYTRRSAQGHMVSPKLGKPKLPQFVVPTTPTTACAKAGSAVFDPADGQRLAMFDPKTRAQSIFIHPELVATAPAALVLSASMNTLAMAVEGIESALGSPVSDGLLMQALRLLAQHLPLRGDGDGATDARCSLVIAAVLCAQGTDFGGGGLASVLGHAIGAGHHIENGIANAIVLPHTMRFNAAATGERAGKIAAALGCGTEGGGAQEAIAAVEAFLARLHLPRRLRDASIPQDALPGIAEHAMSDWFLQKNPHPVSSAHDLQTVLQLAW